MILTCPDCSTRYSVKDGSIGPNGRTVRCASCSATWFVSQDADELALVDLQSSDIETIDDDINMPTHAPREDLGPAQSTFANDTVSNAPPEKETLGAHVQFRDKVDRERRNRRLMGVSMIWIVTLALLGTFAILGYVFRQDVVERRPAAAWVYKIFNISVKENGLDFEDPATRHVIVDGRPVLVVNGMIINRDNKTRPIPMIELSFLSRSGDIIAKWLVEPTQAQLGPKERLEYTSQYPNPPVDAAELLYQFVDDTAAPSGDGADIAPVQIEDGQ